MFVILKTKFVGQLLRFLLTTTYFHGPDICVNIFNRISRPNKKYYTQERSENCCLRHSHCTKTFLSQSPCLLWHVLYLVAKPTFIFRGKPSFSCYPTVRNEWDFLSISPRSKTFKLFTTKMIISAIFTQIKAMGNRDLNTQVVSNKTVLYIMNALSRPTEGGIGKCGSNNPY